MVVRTSYSDQWCRNVVKQLLEKYPRGANILVWYFSYPAHSFAGMLESHLKRDQISWRFIRDLVKAVNAAPSLHGVTWIEDKARELLHKHVGFSAREWWESLEKRKKLRFGHRQGKSLGAELRSTTTA